MIRDNLDIGRPDKVNLIFGRRSSTTAASGPRPAEFRTRVITDNVTPKLSASSTRRRRSSSTTRKARALRTETVINDPGVDLGIGQRAIEPARAAAGRLHRQPAPAGRPEQSATTPSPAPPRCPPSPPRSPTPAGTRSRSALHRRSVQALPSGPVRSSASCPTASPTPTSAATWRPCSGSHSRAHDQRADHLRPPAAAAPRPHRAHPAHLTATTSPTAGTHQPSSSPASTPAFSCHRPRRAHRPPARPPGTSYAPPTAPTDARPRRPCPPGRPRRLNTHTTASKRLRQT